MEINRNNYETFFLLYLDRELNPADMREVESFLSDNADLQKEFALLQQAVFVPSELVFQQKESLYRQEEKKRVVPFYWMRMAAAVAVLMIGCWFLIARSLKSNGLETEQAQHVLPLQKPLAQIKKEEKGNQDASSKNQTGIVKNISGTQINSSRNSHAADAQLKSNAKAKENIKQKNSATPDEQNTGQVEIPAEPVLAIKKTATPELQLAYNSADKEPKQVAAMSGAEAGAMVLSSSDKEEPIQNDETVLKENEYPSDNAISVVSLNNNKGISGFLKKITKRTPADDQTRKLRVSVFQISY